MLHYPWLFNALTGLYLFLSQIHTVYAKPKIPTEPTYYLNTYEILAKSLGFTMHLKGIPAGWQGSTAQVRVKHTYGLTLRSVIQIGALRDCRCCKKKKKKLHFYISCCMERLWSCGWKGWGTGSFKALENAVLACLEHVITFLCLAKNSHISLKSEATRKQAPQNKKSNTIRSTVLFSCLVACICEESVIRWGFVQWKHRRGSFPL